MVHAGPIKIVKLMPYPCLFLHHNGVKGHMSPDSMDKITFLIKLFLWCNSPIVKQNMYRITFTVTNLLLLKISKWSLLHISLDPAANKRDSPSHIILRGKSAGPFYIYLITFGTQWCSSGHQRKSWVIPVHPSSPFLSYLNPFIFP